MKDFFSENETDANCRVIKALLGEDEIQADTAAEELQETYTDRDVCIHPIIDSFDVFDFLDSFGSLYSRLWGHVFDHCEKI